MQQIITQKSRAIPANGTQINSFVFFIRILVLWARKRSRIFDKYSARPSGPLNVKPLYYLYRGCLFL